MILLVTTFFEGPIKAHLRLFCLYFETNEHRDELASSRDAVGVVVGIKEFVKEALEARNKLVAVRDHHISLSQPPGINSARQPRTKISFLPVRSTRSFNFTSRRSLLRPVKGREGQMLRVWNHPNHHKLDREGQDVALSRAQSARPENEGLHCRQMPT